MSEQAEQPVTGVGRAAALLQVVLHEPEIPNNTGNIGRTCVATGCGLHLIRPLAFDTSEKACRRAGLDYWPRLQPREHEHFEAFLAAGVVPARRLWFFTTKAARYAGAVEIAPGDGLVFGKETRGLPDSILQAYPEQLVTLPMMPGERSLNLATAVCAAVYLAMDGFVRRGEVVVDGQGRIGRAGGR